MARNCVTHPWATFCMASLTHKDYICCGISVSYYGMETAIEELQRRHPNLDRMMCETLLKLHEQGKLDKYAPRLDEKPPPPDACILRDAITVENKFSPHTVKQDGTGNLVPNDLSG